MMQALMGAKQIAVSEDQIFVRIDELVAGHIDRG
jgi:hypothetical protein